MLEKKQAEQKQGFSPDFACPKADKARRAAKPVRSVSLNKPAQLYRLTGLEPVSVLTGRI